LLRSSTINACSTILCVTSFLFASSAPFYTSLFLGTFSAREKLPRVGEGPPGGYAQRDVRGGYCEWLWPRGKWGGYTQ